MDLVILKVNGQDVTNSSHEDTLKIFKTAQEPITIEVIRMQPNKCKNTGDSNDLSINTIVNQQQVTSGTKRSSATTTSCTTGVQTDLSGFINVDDDDYFYNYFVYEDDVDGVNYEIAQEQDDEELDVDDREAVEINDYLSNSNNDDEYHQLETYKPEDVDDGSGGAGADEVYLEEITLRKSKSTENLGLTVSYNYDITDRNNPTDITAVAYISEIARDSLAARDGRLREGDQILRINGRDIVNKDQIDKIFYQTQNNIVNILISRCVGQNSPPPAPPSSSVSSSLNNIDDQPPAAATVTASETDEHSPAYQNSMIELLMRQQKQFENSKNNKSLPNETNDDNSDNKILIPPQVPFHNNLPLSTSSLSSATPKNINKSFNKTSQHHSLTSNFKESLKKFEDLSINKKSVTGLVTSTSTVAALAAAACHSDTEHIYETIPESDNEPIYSSPYESQYLPRTFELNQQQHVNQSKLSTKNSSSSIEEKDSSSAYNTGGESCNSNPLLLELYRSDRDGNDEGTMGLSSFDIGSTPTGAMTSIKSPVTFMSTAINCRVKSSAEVTPVTRSNSSSSSLSIVTSPRQPIPKSLLSQEDKKLLSEAHYHQQQQQQQQQYHHNHNYRHQCHHHHHYHNYQNKIPALNPNCQLPQDDNRELAITNNRDDILYTNIDNNDSSKRTTMILQQEIFTQALNRKNFITNRSNTCESDREIRIKNSKSHGKFQAPNLTQYHFIGSSQQMQRNPANDDNAGGKCDPRMEWKVKRRPDGTRYIARRSVRNRLLGNRTLEIFEERAGQTTEDDTVSEIKLGRYWNKDERKRHIEHARQRKLRHQAAMPPPAPPTTLVAQQHFKLRRDFNCEHRADDSAVTTEATSTKELSKKLIQDAIMTHVNRIDDNHDEEDGMLGGGGGTAGDDDALTINGKLKGLLSVTTV